MNNITRLQGTRLLRGRVLSLALARRGLGESIFQGWGFLICRHSRINSSVRSFLARTSYFAWQIASRRSMKHPWEHCIIIWGWEQDQIRHRKKRGSVEKECGLTIKFGLFKECFWGIYSWVQFLTRKCLKGRVVVWMWLLQILGGARFLILS